MKKFLLLCLMALFCSLSTRAQNYEFWNGDLFYNIVDVKARTCEVGSGNGSTGIGGIIVVPERVIGPSSSDLVDDEDYDDEDYEEDDYDDVYTVVGLALEALEYCSAISIVVPNTVTYIEEAALHFCYDLISLTLGSSVETIGGSAFTSDVSLEEIYSLNPTPPIVADYGEIFNRETERSLVDVPVETCILYVPQGSREAYEAADIWKEFKHIVELDGDISIETLEATNITNTTATLNGVATTNSEKAITEQGFEYWADQNDVQRIAVTEVGDNGELSATIENLSPATEYTFRTYVITEDEPTIYGERMTFTTTANDFSDEGIYYKILTDGTLAVIPLYYASDDNIVAYEGEINIPEKVTMNGTTYTVVMIDEYAFYECRNLTKVTIPETVTDMGPYSFYNCTSLIEVTMPNTISTIWDYTFYGCTKLTTINIPSTVTSIRAYAFNGSGLTEVTIPGSVQTITTAVFSSCISLKKVTIEEGVPNLGDRSMFDSCTSLEEISIPESVTEIAPYTFQYCSSLKSITIPSKVTRIPSYAFYGCSRLEEISMPSTVSEMGSYAFGTCTSLKRFEFPDAMVDTGEACVLYICTNLEDVTFSKNTTKISNMTFSQCNGLKEINIPEGVTEIGYQVFYMNHNLKEATLPSTLTSMEGRTFYRCNNLVRLYSLNPIPPTLDDSHYKEWFYGIDDNCVLYVPVGAKENYSTTNVWKDFYDIVEMTDFAISTLEATNITDTSATLNGSITAAYDDPITEKGFEYWTGDSEVQKAIVEGDEMTATVSDLAYDTVYTYRAYATMESGTTEYGEEQTFTTAVPDGISNIHAEDENVEGIYSTSGQKLNTTVKGVNIIRYNDGTTKKVLVK